MKLTINIMSFMMVLILGGFLNNAEANEAKHLYKVRCARCHGDTAQGVTGYSPKLAGQHTLYLIDQIKDIRSGARNNGLSRVMRSIFKKLNDEQIKNISTWLRSQE